MNNLKKIKPSERSTIDAGKIEKGFYDAMNDDLNSPAAISYLFDGIRDINSLAAGNESITATDLCKIKKTFHLIRNFCPD